MAKSCKTRKVKITKKHGRRLSTPITFTAHTGSGCPKPKRKTGHLAPYKRLFKIEAKACTANARKRGKWSRAAFNSCIKQGMRAQIRANR